MKHLRIMLATLALLVASPLWAQNAAESPSNQPPESLELERTTKQTPPPMDWSHKLTGDWGGARTELANMGLTLDVDLTQVMMVNTRGGASTNSGFRYSGSTDYTLTINTQKMGLWPGGMILINAETKWGDSVIDKAGALSPVNMDAIKPGFGDGCEMTLSEWILFQRLDDKGMFTLVAGKLDGSRAFDQNAFANDERTQFMNTALRNNLVIPTFLPYTDLGIGLVFAPNDWFRMVTAVADAEGDPSRTGFDTAFHDDANTTVIHEFGFKVHPFDLEGNYRFGFIWSSKDTVDLVPRTPFRQTGGLMMSILGRELATKVVQTIAPFDTNPDNIAVYFNFDQWLWKEAGTTDQGIGAFGRYGWARADVNAVNHFYSMGLGGKGLIPGRDRDTCGIGMYHLNLSNELPSMFHSETGFECYYNIEVTPWLHVSPDLQVIVDPGGTDDNDVAVVGGIRVQMNL